MTSIDFVLLILKTTMTYIRDFGKKCIGFTFGFDVLKFIESQKYYK